MSKDAHLTFHEKRPMTAEENMEMENELFKDVPSEGEPGMVFVEDEVEAVKHLTQEEMNEGPLPPWAIDRAKGILQLGAQLPTRDGRRCGNAHIIKVEPCEFTPYGVQDAEEGSPHNLYTLLTDAGSSMQMTAGEVSDQFYPPVWVSDVKDVKRKFGRDE